MGGREGESENQSRRLEGERGGYREREPVEGGRGTYEKQIVWWERNRGVER